MSNNNDVKDGERGNTNSPTIKKPKLKIGDEFLKILGDNTFNGMGGGDVTDHIAKVLKITEWIKIPNVDKNELRLHIFSKSLCGDAEKWWNYEIEGTATTWKELGDKFFHKYYPLSHTCNSKILDDLDNETDYFEFLYWLASKFDNYWEIDKNTKSGLWEFYVNEHTKGTIGDLDNEPCKENSKKTRSYSFFKPYLDAQDGKDIYEVLDRNILRYRFPLLATSATQTSCAKLKNSRLYDIQWALVKNSSLWVQAKLVLWKEPLAACPASTTKSSTKKITGGP
ncbi:hypothetical protein Tco_0438886 [Tanacetum coccineum]